MEAQPSIEGTGDSKARMVSSSEEALVTVQRGRKLDEGRGRPSSASLLQRDGPVRLVVVVSQPGGRWSQELQRSTRGRQVLMRMEQATVEAIPDLFANEKPGPGSGEFVVGLAAVASWRLVLDSRPSSDQSNDLIRVAASLVGRKRKEVRFIEHPFLDAACVVGGVDPLPWAGQPPFEKARLSLETLQEGPAVVVCGGRRQLVQDVLSRWAWRWRGLLSSSPVWWPVEPWLAMALAMGRWTGDVTALFTKRRPGDLSVAPLMPGAGVLAAFRKTAPWCARCTGTDDAADTGHVVRVWQPSGRGRKPRFYYSPAHLITALRSSNPLRDRGDAKENIENCARYLFPTTWEKVRAQVVEVRPEDMPCPSTLRTMMVRLDCAYMLFRRETNASVSAARSWRYVSFDASPQGGQEIFVAVERVVDPYGGAPGTPLSLQSFKFPLAVLGAGRMGLAEKAQAFAHQTWLDYGPSATSVRAGNARVRTILSDMGTELGIADLRDFVDSFIPAGAGWAGAPMQVGAAEADQEEEPEPAFMFPNAIGVPGTQHILDNVLYSSIKLLELWPSFEKELKAVAQWLAPVGNRRALQHMLRLRVPAEEEVIQKLDRTMDRFAQWRWKTLSSCLYSLSQLEPALRLVTAVTTLEVLARRRKTRGDVDKFWAGIDSHHFWSTVTFLLEVVEPMRTFAAWVRGCECCEAQRKAGKEVDCPWAGCRAASLFGRWRQAMQELQEMREDSQGPWADERLPVLSHMLSALDVKMRWVDDGPFLLWRLFDPDGPAVAGRMLAERDQLVEAGGRAHRVVERFTGAGALRRPMQAFAAGAGMSAELEEEVKSYCLGKIDDTWAEAGHRDASRVLKRCTSVTLPYVSAFLRSDHILAEIDRMDRGQRGRFHKLLRSWAAIGQPDAKKARRLKRRRDMKAKANGPGKRNAWKRTMGVVYRFDEIAMQEWDRQLGGVALSALSNQPTLRRSIVDRLQAEHLQSVLPVGKVLSICDAENGRLVAREAGLGPDREPGDREAYLMVLNLHSRRQRRVATTTCRVEAQMACQVSVQRFEVMDRAADQEEGAVRVRTRGLPEVVDLLDLFTWSALTTGVRRWSATAAEPGVRLLCSASPLPICDDWRDPRICLHLDRPGLPQGPGLGRGRRQAPQGASRREGPDFPGKGPH